MNKIEHITIAIVAIIGLSLALLPVVIAQSVKIGPRCVANGSATTLFGGSLMGRISSTPIAPLKVTIYNRGVPIYDAMGTCHDINEYLDKGGSIQVTVTNYQFYEVTLHYHLTVSGSPVLLSWS
mgnify:CR=1 FL=1